VPSVEVAIVVHHPRAISLYLMPAHHAGRGLSRTAATLDAVRSIVLVASKLTAGKSVESSP